MLPRDLLDLGDLVDYITDLGYAAAAAGEFSLEAHEYRAAYDRLYALYREVVSAREIIEAEANAVIPERVSRAIYSLSLIHISSAYHPRTLICPNATPWSSR